MKSHIQQTEGTSARQQADSGAADEFQLAGDTEEIDPEAEDFALHQNEQLANASPQSVQLKRYAGIAAASPTGIILGHAQHAADSSPRTMQLTRHAGKVAGSRSNNTGLPDNLKAGIESLSGMSMDYVKVHYNSDKPAQLNAHAYAQGSEIHVGAGQERHLPHEAWHIVQQAQGRVRPTCQMKVGAVNDDPLLEREADMMGERAAQFCADDRAQNSVAEPIESRVVTQRVVNLPHNGLGLPFMHQTRLNRVPEAGGLRPVQCVTYLRDAAFTKPKRKLARKLRRVIRKAQGKLGWKNTSKKNIFVLRFVSHDGKRHYNLVTRSAGLGGKHPRGVGGRSAAHTEPQAEAFLQNPFVMGRVEEKVGTGHSLESIFSSNLPCSSSGGGTADGCGGMTTDAIGSPGAFYSTSSDDYVGGKGPNLRQVVRALVSDDDDTDTASVGSYDSDMDESDLRGEELPTAKLKNPKKLAKIAKAVRRAPKVHVHTSSKKKKAAKK